MGTYIEFLSFLDDYNYENRENKRILKIKISTSDIYFKEM